MRMLKFLLCGLLMALPVLAEETEDRQTATSLRYVSHELDTRQNKLTTGQDKALTYTNAAGNVEQRTVKENLNGGTTDTSLPQVNAVNTGLSTKQNDIATIDDHTAVTYTGQIGTIGQKGIYQTDGTYAAQSDNLIDAKTFNAALKNGLDNEFVCADRPDAYAPGTNTCWLWEIHNNPATGHLPPGYTELEYLETTGSPYVDTGIVGKSGISVQAKFIIANTGAGALMGNRQSGNTRFFPVLWANSGWDATIGDDRITGLLATNTIYTTYFNSTSSGWTFDVNNERISSGNAVGSNTNNMWMFAINNNGNPQYPFRGKMFFVKIWQDGDLVREFIPAKHDNVIGVYDKVSRTFFTAQGNGELVAGPALNAIYIPQNQ